MKNYIHCIEDLLPVVLSNLVGPKLRRDERVEGTVIKKEICRQFSLSDHTFFPLLGNTAVAIDIDLAFDTTSSLLLD